MTTTMKVIAAFAAIGVFAASGLGGDKPLAWPQFRGPGGSGVAEGQKPPVEFGPDKNVKWKVPVPRGLLLADRRGRQARPHRVRRRETLHDRLQPRRRQRSCGGPRPRRSRSRTSTRPRAARPRPRRRPTASGSCPISARAGCSATTCPARSSGSSRCRRRALRPTSAAASRPIIVDGIVVLLRDEMKDPKILAVDAVNGKRPSGRRNGSLCVSWCTPVVWDTPAGKQIVAPGYGEMIGYDLKTGEEKWSVAGHAVRVLHVAGRRRTARCSSPAGRPATPRTRTSRCRRSTIMLKQAGEEKLGYLTKAGSEKTFLKGFFEIKTRTRTASSPATSGTPPSSSCPPSKNSAFALKAGGTGDVTKTHVLWKKKKGLPYVASALVYRGQLRDGQGRRAGHRLRREDGQGRLRSGAGGRGRARTTPRRWPPTGTSISRPWTTAPSRC